MIIAPLPAKQIHRATNNRFTHKTNSASACLRGCWLGAHDLSPPCSLSPHATLVPSLPALALGAGTGGGERTAANLAPLMWCILSCPDRPDMVLKPPLPQDSSSRAPGSEDMDVHACFANQALASLLTCISAHGVKHIPLRHVHCWRWGLGVISRNQLGGGEPVRSKLASSAWLPLAPSWVSRSFGVCRIAKYLSTARASKKVWHDFTRSWCSWRMCFHNSDNVP